jgi:hypothetical protein
LVEIVNSLLDKSIEVVSATCDIHDAYDAVTGKDWCIGKRVQLQIELGQLPPEMLDNLPRGWSVYEYHTIVDNKIGPASTGLCHVDSFVQIDEVCEFATTLTISNLELYLDRFDNDGVEAVLRLDGYAIGQ